MGSTNSWKSTPETSNAAEIILKTEKSQDIILEPEPITTADEDQGTQDIGTEAKQT